MCGFLGLMAVGSQRERGVSASPAHIATALERIRYRGPDGSRIAFLAEGRAPLCIDMAQVIKQPDSLTTEKAPSVVLGHNRLAIIDRSDSGAQPMGWLCQNSTGAAVGSPAFWLVYNGEIYNYRELRSDLIAQGVRFRTESDSEVLLALYERHGPAMLDKLNGIFAFALWDVRQQRLFLARDRYGTKPLYYTRLAGGDFAFASETKSLLALPGIDKSLDYSALSEHLTFQTMLADRTLLKSIRLLEPGCYALLDAETGHWQHTRYWEPIFEPTTPVETERDLRNTAAQIRHLLEQAVQRQLTGDVLMGSLLSGGLDSAAITAIAARLNPNRWPTFTAGFELDGLQSINQNDEQAEDERLAARQLAEAFGTRHRELAIDANALPHCLDSLVWHLDDFRAGISYPNYLVNQMAREDVTVVLSGVGGDELFAGYPWRYEPLLAFDDAPVVGGLSFESHYYQTWTRLLSESEKETLFTTDAWQALDGFSTRDSFSETLATCHAKRAIDRALCFDFKTFLPALLLVEDRLSMAHGLESRVPFLDNDLVDACLGLPTSVKLRGQTSEQSPRIAKWILKEALKDLLPATILERRKQGFTPPDATWYRGAHRPYIENILLSPISLERGLFRPTALKALLEEHFNGSKNRRFLIWSLLCLEIWHRQHGI